MKIFFSLTALSLVISLAACKQAPQEDTTVDNAKLAIATASSCPQADEKGNIIIAPGLTATIIANGHGRAAETHDYADVHTTLWLYDEEAEGGRGTEIWTSGGVKPFQLQIGRGQVIKGWDLGLPCMLVGETRELIISPGLGYGVAGKPPVPPNATLLFNIELLRLETP